MCIDLFTFISKGSSDYAEFLKQTSEKFLSGEHTLNWKFIESANADRFPNGYEHIVKAKTIKAGNFGAASINHGHALNTALEYISEEYVIFIDSDMVVLYPEWDKIVVQELNNRSFFGGSHGEGQGQSSKHRGFPAVFFFAFRADVLDKVKLDFLPFDYKNNKLIYSYPLNKKEAKIFGKKENEELKCDTGWKIPRIADKGGLTNTAMPMVLMTSKHRQLPFETLEQKNHCFKKHALFMYEWHYNGTLFATHQHGSRDGVLQKGIGKIWKNRVELYIKNCKQRNVYENDR